MYTPTFINGKVMGLDIPEVENGALYSGKHVGKNTTWQIRKFNETQNAYITFLNGNAISVAVFDKADTEKRLASIEKSNAMMKRILEKQMS